MACTVLGVYTVYFIFYSFLSSQRARVQFVAIDGMVLCDQAPTRQEHRSRPMSRRTALYFFGPNLKFFFLLRPTRQGDSEIFDSLYINRAIFTQSCSLRNTVQYVRWRARVRLVAFCARFRFPRTSRGSTLVCSQAYPLSTGAERERSIPPPVALQILGPTSVQL